MAVVQVVGGCPWIKKIFVIVAVFAWLGFLSVDADNVSVLVMEGDSVTLHTDVKINQQERIKWYFNDIRIAQIIDNQSKICTDDQCHERFRDRLKLDHQTGSLTITNTTTADSGLYKLLNSRSSSIEEIFNVSVHEFPLQKDPLTITNTRNTDSGDHQLEITSHKHHHGCCTVTSMKKFHVDVLGSARSSAVRAVIIGSVLMAAVAAVGLIYCRWRIYRNGMARNMEGGLLAEDSVLRRQERWRSCDRRGFFPP